MNDNSRFLELKPKLYSLEKQRKVLLQQLNQQLYISVAIFFAAAVVIYYFLLPKTAIEGWQFNDFFFFVIAGFIVHAGHSYFKTKKISQYKGTIKERIMGELISSIDPNLSYDPIAYVDKNDFHQSGLFDESVSKYKGEDLISGRRNDLSFQLSEISVDKGSNKHPNIFFTGVFMVIDLAEAVQGQTFVLPASYQESFSSRMSKKLWNGGRPGEVVSIADSAFNEVFQVISDDPISAQELLTPSFREVLLELEDVFACDLRLCLKDRKLYLAIATWDDMFAISHQDNLLEPELVEDFEEELDLLLQVVDVLSVKEEKELP